MQTFGSITDARNAIMDYPMADLPEAIQARFRELRGSPSPVDQIVKVGELLYANRADIGEGGRSLAGGLVAYATTNAWHGLQDNNRGDQIVGTLRRDMGERASGDMTWPKEGEEPAALFEFLPKQEQEAAEPPSS